MARIAGVDLPREKRVEIGLTYVYGIGHSSAVRILNEAGVSYRSMNYPYGHDWVLWRKLIVDVFDNILWK